MKQTEKCRMKHEETSTQRKKKTLPAQFTTFAELLGQKSSETPTDCY